MGLLRMDLKHQVSIKMWVIKLNLFLQTQPYFEHLQGGGEALPTCDQPGGGKQNVSQITFRRSTLVHSTCASSSTS